VSNHLFYAGKVKLDMNKKDRRKNRIREQMKTVISFTQKIDFRRAIFFLIMAFLILYIICFGKLLKADKKWKENMISSNQTRTNMSYYDEDTQEENDYEAQEEKYLFVDGIVDTMQEKTLMRAANKDHVRKRLTNASKGIGVGDEIEVDGAKIEFVDQTIVDGDEIKISYKDYEVMQRIVEAEATGLDEKSKILVANVLLNRVRSSEFPNTVEEVVFQEVNGVVQFQPISDGRYDTVEIKDDTVDAVNKAILGVDYSQGALYFLARSGSRKSSVTWFDQNLTWLFEYEGHEFYK